MTTSVDRDRERTSTPKIGSSARLTPLPKPVQAALRSSVIIPTLPHLLSELLHNSLDAGAGNIGIWIDARRDGQSIRVEDDGVGIRPGEGGLGSIGGRWRSSKGGNRAGSTSEGGGEAGKGSYGFRGEALASMAALGLLEIITRPEGCEETYAKVIRGSKVLFEGVSSRSLGRERGTTIVVKDLFHDIPVRQASLSANSSSLIASCKKVVETLALVRPNVKWTLWEEAAVWTSTAGAGVKKMLSIHGAQKSVDVFRAVYGSAGVEKVQSIRVSSGTKRIDGFISLEGTVTRSHQHLYINGYPLDKCDFHALIAKQFSRSRFSSATDDSPYTGSGRKSPRRLERHPIYVLNIQIPPSELDAAYTPGKTVMGYKDEAALQKFVGAVIDEFLRRHEFVNPAKGAAVPEIAEKGGSPSRPSSAPVSGGGGMGPPVTPIMRPASVLSGPRTQRLGFPQSVVGQRPVSTGKSQTESGFFDSRHVSPQMSTPCIPLQRDVPVPPTPADRSRLAQRRAITPARLNSTGDGSTPRVGEKRKAEMLSSDYRVDESGRKRYRWIDDILAGVDDGVLPFTPKTPCLQINSPKGPERTCCHASHAPHTPALSARPYSTPTNDLRPTTNLTFSAATLSQASILGQVDFKFICAVIPSSSDSSSTLVLIDQHAADERVSIEAILKELCDGFIADSVPITELVEPLPALILTRGEAQELCAKGVREIFARWGVELDLSGVPVHDKEQAEALSGYVQIPVQAVPTALKARLGRKEASEMTRLIKLYLTVLENGMGQVEALIWKGESKEGKVDWGEVLRWMPKEMLELANSKACRNAIMFGDRLTNEQCERLVSQLAKMRLPFMCAHGRPSLVPVMRLEGEPKLGKRRIDWEGWKLRSRGVLWPDRT